VSESILAATRRRPVEEELDAILDEDGTEILDEDGTPILDEGAP
jgi:hypothetical protein